MNQKVPAQPGHDDTFKVPSVEYGTSSEEQALRKEQEKMQDDLKKRQRDELQSVQQSIDKDSKDSELAIKKSFEQNLEQAIREKKNKQAAEIKARPDITKEQMDAVRMLCCVAHIAISNTLYICMYF